MQSCAGLLCRRRCLAAAAATGSRGPPPPLTRAYSAPTYPVNSADLPDPRGTRSDSWQQQQQQQSGLYGNTAHRGRGDGADGDSDHHHAHPFTKLDLQNPPQMPSPTYYATYEEYMEAYDQFLRETEHFTTAARAFMQKRFQKLRATQADVADVVRREYLWTFLPLIFCLSVFMIDRSNHSAAAFTHRVIKERAKQQVKHIKWESV